MRNSTAARLPTSGLMPLLGTATAFLALVTIGVVGGANVIMAMM